MKIRGTNLTTCFNFCKCFSNRNVSCDVCIRGKKHVYTNSESSGNVDNFFKWSCCSSIEPVRLYSSWCKSKQVRRKFTKASWPLVASGWIEPHRFNVAAATENSKSSTLPGISKFVTGYVFFSTMVLTTAISQWTRLFFNRSEVVFIKLLMIYY